MREAVRCTSTEPAYAHILIVSHTPSRTLETNQADSSVAPQARGLEDHTESSNEVASAPLDARTPMSCSGRGSIQRVARSFMPEARSRLTEGTHRFVNSQVTRSSIHPLWPLGSKTTHALGHDACVRGATRCIHLCLGALFSIDRNLFRGSLNVVMTHSRLISVPVT